jgi:hypothetical protein
VSLISCLGGVCTVFLTHVVQKLVDYLSPRKGFPLTDLHWGVRHFLDRVWDDVTPETLNPAHKL